MDLEAVKDFFRPTKWNVSMTFLLLIGLFIGFIFQGAGGMPCSLMFFNYYILNKLTYLLMDIALFAGSAWFFILLLVLLSYVISCGFYTLSKIGKFWKMVSIVVFLLLVFGAYPVCTEEGLAPQGASNACSNYCERAQSGGGDYLIGNFCNTSLTVRGFGEVTCPKLGIECPGIDCSEYN